MNDGASRTPEGTLHLSAVALGRHQAIRDGQPGSTGALSKDVSRYCHYRATSPPPLPGRAPRVVHALDTGNVFDRTGFEKICDAPRSARVARVALGLFKPRASRYTSLAENKEVRRCTKSSSVLS